MLLHFQGVDLFVRGRAFATLCWCRGLLLQHVRSCLGQLKLSVSVFDTYLDSCFDSYLTHILIQTTRQIFGQHALTQHGVLTR